jgi:argininosuccinate lyase
VPFRETHHISGAAVKMAEDRGCSLSDLSPADLRTIHPLFDDDVSKVGKRGAAGSMRPGHPHWGCCLSVPRRRCRVQAVVLALLLAFNNPPAPTTPLLRQVWDFSRSADARDTEGGASKRSLLQQVEKMRKYLADSA